MVSATAACTLSSLSDSMSPSQLERVFPVIVQRLRQPACDPGAQRHMMLALLFDPMQPLVEKHISELLPLWLTFLVPKQSDSNRPNKGRKQQEPKPSPLAKVYGRN